MRAQALDQLQSLREEPRPARARELRDRPGVYRIWLAGRWGIAYQIDDDEQRICVLRVRRKEQMDYESLTVPDQPPDA